MAYGYTPSSCYANYCDIPIVCYMITNITLVTNTTTKLFDGPPKQTKYISFPSMSL